MRTYKQEIVSHQQYAHNLVNNLITYILRNSREVSSKLVDAALVLMLLNLEAARDILESLYSPNPRGRKPYDPVCMLRALILMVLLQKDSIPKFALNSPIAFPDIAGKAESHI